MTASGEQTVYLVEDDPSTRRLIGAIAQTLNIACLSFSTAGAFLNHFQARMSGCIVLDMVMPDINGLALQQELLLRGSALPIIFVTGNGDVPSAVAAMRRGAFNFLQKPVTHAEMKDNIVRALALDHHNRRTLAGINAIRERLQSLTPREREVLDEVSLGHPNKVIAINLHISERSVEFHRSKAMEKMGAASVAQLMRMLMAVEGNMEGNGGLGPLH